MGNWRARVPHTCVGCPDVLSRGASKGKKIGNTMKHRINQYWILKKIKNTRTSKQTHEAHTICSRVLLSGSSLSLHSLSFLLSLSLTHTLSLPPSPSLPSSLTCSSLLAKSLELNHTYSLKLNHTHISTHTHTHTRLLVLAR